MEMGSLETQSPTNSKPELFADALRRISQQAGLSVSGPLLDLAVRRGYDDSALRRDEQAKAAGLFESAKAGMESSAQVKTNYSIMVKPSDATNITNEHQYVAEALAKLSADNGLWASIIYQKVESELGPVYSAEVRLSW